MFNIFIKSPTLVDVVHCLSVVASLHPVFPRTTADNFHSHYKVSNFNALFDKVHAKADYKWISFSSENQAAGYRQMKQIILLTR